MLSYAVNLPKCLRFSTPSPRFSDVFPHAFGGTTECSSKRHPHSVTASESFVLQEAELEGDQDGLADDQEHRNDLGGSLRNARARKLPRRALLEARDVLHS